MTAAFQLVGLARDPFEHLFDVTDDELRKMAPYAVATESPGFPCRISLEDAKVGEELLLLPYVHQPASSPYRASGPIFHPPQRRAMSTAGRRDSELRFSTPHVRSCLRCGGHDDRGNSV